MRVYKEASIGVGIAQSASGRDVDWGGSDISSFRFLLVVVGAVAVSMIPDVLAAQQPATPEVAGSTVPNDGTDLMERCRDVSLKCPTANGIKMLVFSSDSAKLFAVPRGTFFLPPCPYPDATCYVLDLAAGDVRPFCRFAGRAIHLIALSPRGDMLATSTFRQLQHQWEGRGQTRVSLFAMSDGQLIHEFTTGQESLNALAFSASGEFIQYCDRSGVSIHECATGKRSKHIPAKEPTGIAAEVVFSPDGRHLAMEYRGSIVIAALSSGQTTVRIHHNEPSVLSFAYSAHGKYIAAVVGMPNAWRLRVWEADSGKPVNCRIDGLSPKACSFLPGSDLLGVVDQRSVLALCLLQASKPVCTIDLAPGSLGTFAPSPNGQYLAAGGEDDTVVLWRLGGALP